MSAENRVTSPARSNLDRIPAHSATGMILRWIALTLLGVLAVGALIFVGDYVIFFVRGKPLDTVNVTRYMAAPLKGNKTEFYYEGSGPLSCSRSLFPQSGWQPCWYLRRHPLAAEPA
jgi:hypothetical protein